MPIPSTYTYTVEEYEKLIEEWIDKTTPYVNEDGKTIFNMLPNPATLRLHLNFSPSTICEYKKLEKHKPYRKATFKAYSHMEAYGWSDLHYGQGKAGNFMLGRVMGYSETTKVEQTNKTVEFRKDLDKMTEKEAEDILKELI